MQIRFLFPFLLIGLLMIGAWIGYSRYTTKQELELAYTIIPSIQVVSLNGEFVDLKLQALDNLSVLIYFNSTCSICQSEAELIESTFRADTLTRFLWVSSEPMEEVRNFAVESRLDSLSSHHFFLIRFTV
ncbi:MAG: hypothetical protein LPK25_13600 [Cyclobacteriaceae bacterium]|nr:hypothetical protein [Cyclobacteriaceae bacterium]MDX5467541.1 hypothetical protein [Cyclobacteriaceae bacterium]